MEPTKPAASPVRILVVDDEESLRYLLRLILERAGWSVVEAADGQAALAALDRDPGLRIVLCDIRMPRLDGTALLDAVRGRGLRVVLMSAFGTTDTAVEALSRGAWDYVSKPFRSEEIRVTIERILEHDRLEAENRALRAAVAESHELDGFLGRSAVARGVMDLVRQVAAYPSTVLFTGESGTGKELLSRALHRLSPRSERPFVAINCAAIPESLLESELFGHERGSFTGAVRAHAGIFEQADGGTLLLDEIGDMPLPVQTRLLRVLEDGRVRRVGGSKDVGVDVRVVAATAVDLEGAVRAGQFREDLYYRLNVVHIRIPSLRARREDIPLLAQALVARAAQRLGRDVVEIGVDALRQLVLYDWPGNVRQLENALERAVLMGSGREVELSDLPPELLRPMAPAAVAAGGGGEGAEGEEDLSIKRRTAALERELIARALARTGGNRTHAARLLDLSYKALVYKIRDYGLDGAGGAS
jgi:two-component system response regulator AtoC